MAKKGAQFRVDVYMYTEEDKASVMAKANSEKMDMSTVGRILFSAWLRDDIQIKTVKSKV